VTTADGKGVVMHQQDLREQTRKSAQKRKPQMETRLSKGEKKNAKRMATVAAVYTIDTFERTPQDILPGNNNNPNKEKSPRPEQKRVWASIRQKWDLPVPVGTCEQINCFIRGILNRPRHNRSKAWRWAVVGLYIAIRSIFS
jgi:hypothetical protein